MVRGNYHNHDDQHNDVYHDVYLQYHYNNLNDYNIDKHVYDHNVDNHVYNDDDFYDNQHYVDNLNYDNIHWNDYYGFNHDHAYSARRQASQNRDSENPICDMAEGDP